MRQPGKGALAQMDAEAPPNMALVHEFASQLQVAVDVYYLREYRETIGIHMANAAVKVIPKRKFVNVDVGRSGKFLVSPGNNVWGIKAYGVRHTGYWYGRLEDILANGFWWDGYVIRTGTPPHRKPAKRNPAGHRRASRANPGHRPSWYDVYALRRDPRERVWVSSVTRTSNESDNLIAFSDVRSRGFVGGSMPESAFLRQYRLVKAQSPRVIGIRRP